MSWGEMQANYMKSGITLTEFWDSTFWEWEICLSAYQKRQEDALEIAGWNGMWAMRAAGCDVQHADIMGRRQVRDLVAERTWGDHE
jgi:hypothetical protein